MKAYLNSLDQLTRRRFVERSAKSMLGVSLLPLAGAGTAQAAPGGGKAKRLIFLYMNGGMSHLETFDPKTNAEIKGPTTPINTNVAGVKIANHLPLLAKQMDKMAIIRSMNSKTGVHENGQYLMRTGYRKRATIVHPCLGPWGQKMEGRRNKTLPDSVVIGTGGGHPGSGFLSAKYNPVPIRDPNSGLQNIRSGMSDAQLERRLGLANKFDESFVSRFDHVKVNDYSDLYDETISLMRSEELEAFNLNKEAANVRSKYGQNRFGQGCLLARRLVEKDVRYVEVEAGGWDMHNYIGEAIVDKAAMIDQAISSLLDDLAKKGLLETTMVALCSEFGRTPNINDNSGRDHHPRCFSTMIAGGGVRGGQVHGSSDAKGYAVTDGQVTIQDFVATLGHGLGLDTEKIVYSSSGRPFTIGDKGKPVTSLFG